MAEDQEVGTGGGMFHDERGNLSAARILLTGMLSQSVLYIFLCLFREKEPSNVVLAFDTSVVIALASWAGGARIAQYLGPQIASAGNAIGQSLRALVAKRRDPTEGIESTP